MPPLLAVALIVFCEGLTFGAALPVLDAYGRSFGAGSAGVGLLFALVSLPKIITNPLFGRWSDRVGRRPALALASLGTLGGSVCWALAQNFWMLLTARLITGVFSAQAGLAIAVGADTSPPEKRAAAVGMLGAAFGIALAIGPPLGGLWAHWFGPAAIGWASAALQIVALLVVAFCLRESRPARPASPRSGARELFGMELLREPAVTPVLLCTLLITVASSVMIATLAAVLGPGYGFDERAIGWAWGLFGIVALVVQGGLIRWAVPRFGEHAVAIVGAVLLALGLAGVAAGPRVELVWVALLLAAAGVALTTPSLGSLLSRAVGPDAQGAVAGLGQAFLGLGRGGGNLIGGSLQEHFGRLASYGCAALLCAVAAVWVRWLPRPAPHRSGHGASEPAAGPAGVSAGK